ncbi:ABC transporter ATP-binding protein [Bacteroidota bacterium]
MDKSIAIRAVKLTRRFGEISAVNNLSLEIQRGGVFGFLGPNGAGKTTAIHMICGLLKPTDGDVEFFDESGEKTIRSKSNVGLCPQDIIIWSKLTCIEQLQFMGEMYGMNTKEARKRGNELLDMLGLEAKRKKLAKTLSGGMKRRLNLCLALIHDPDIVILDEPEAGLDPQSRILVREFIKDIGKQKTVILTTHNMDEADRMADMVAIIDRGSLLMLETPDNLKKSTGEGDTLEITLKDANINTLQLKNLLSEFADHIQISESTIIMKVKNSVEKIPRISFILNNEAIPVQEIKMRENTLEDVFIHLTGRGLRE